MADMGSPPQLELGMKHGHTRCSFRARKVREPKALTAGNRRHRKRSVTLGAHDACCSPSAQLHVTKHGMRHMQGNVAARYAGERSRSMES